MSISLRSSLVQLALLSRSVAQPRCRAAVDEAGTAPSPGIVGADGRRGGWPLASPRDGGGARRVQRLRAPAWRVPVPRPVVALPAQCSRRLRAQRPTPSTPPPVHKSRAKPSLRKRERTLDGCGAQDRRGRSARGPRSSRRCVRFSIPFAVHHHSMARRGRPHACAPARAARPSTRAFHSRLRASYPPNVSSSDV